MTSTLPHVRLLLGRQSPEKGGKRPFDFSFFGLELQFAKRLFHKRVGSLIAAAALPQHVTHPAFRSKTDKKRGIFQKPALRDHGKRRGDFNARCDAVIPLKTRRFLGGVRLNRGGGRLR